MLTTRLFIATLAATALLLGSTPGCGGGQRTKSKTRITFDRLDTDGDGQLSIGEYARTRAAATSDNPRALFDQLDTSNEGKLSYAEFKAAGPKMLE